MGVRKCPSFPLALSFDGCPQRPIGPDWGGGGPRHPWTLICQKSAGSQEFADTHNLGRPRKASESAWKIADSHISRRRKPAGDFSGTSTSRKQKRSLSSPAHISSPGSAPLSPAWNPSREEGESLDALGQRGRFPG